MAGRGKINRKGVAAGMRAADTRGLTDSDVSGLLQIKADNRKAVEEAIDQALVRGLEGVGIAAESLAKAQTPVDTGRLRNSITYEISEGEEAVYVGTNVEYAPYVEFREDVSHKTGKAHFLRDSATDNADKFRKILENALRAG